MQKLKFSLYTLLSFAIILTILITSYNSNKPKKQVLKSMQPQSITANMEEISFHNLESTLLSNDGTYYLWFCDTNDENCNFVENEFVIPMLETLKIDRFEKIHKVNFTDCPFSKQRLEERYQVSSILAFVKVTVTNGDIEYHDSLSWTKDNTFDYDDLQAWLYKHEIWQDAYVSTVNN